MNFTLDSFMVVLVPALVAVGQFIKTELGEVKIFGKELKKFLPLILLVVAIVAEVVYYFSASTKDVFITYILKAII